MLYEYDQAAKLERRRLRAKLLRMIRKAEQDGAPAGTELPHNEGCITSYALGLRDARNAL